MTYNRKLSTTVEEQIEKLKSRGMIITDMAKARIILSNVCYYRFCSYSYPFEKLYPTEGERDHEYKNNVDFESVHQLYNFDFKLRSILLKYLPIIETRLKTTIINVVSNKYIDSPTWFVDSTIVHKDFIFWFDKKVYNDNFRLNETIKKHHKKYINDKYAPAWKTIEYMTLGAVIKLFKAIKDDKIKTQISQNFGVNSTNIFINYLESIRDLRNFCAHGSVIYDLRLKKGITKGPATPELTDPMKTNIYGVIKIVVFFLDSIYDKIKSNFLNDVTKTVEKYKEHPLIRVILETCSGF